MNINTEDMDNLRHMLGISNLCKPEKWGYRNYFNTDEHDTSMLRLILAGLVTRGRVTPTDYGVNMYFHATEKGCRFAGLSEEKSREAGK